MTIATALQWIEVTQIEKDILCTDSCSALKSLKSFTSHSQRDIVNEIYENLYRFKNMNILIIFMWIQAHMGIKGYEKVDSLAKQTLKNEEVMNISLSKYEAKAVIKAYTTKEWQHKWDTLNTERHLYEIQRGVGVVRITKRSITEENILTRFINLTNNKQTSNRIM